MTGAGQPQATPDDSTFHRRFSQRRHHAKLGVTLETVVLGAYLGAVDGLQTHPLVQPVARIAASEAQHLSLSTRMTGGDPIGISFPNALSIDEASNALDAYMS
jgi:hypothetical protein